jgi:hypothetical protein
MVRRGYRRDCAAGISRSGLSGGILVVGCLMVVVLVLGLDLLVVVVEKEVVWDVKLVVRLLWGGSRFVRVERYEVLVWRVLCLLMVSMFAVYRYWCYMRMCVTLYLALEVLRGLL